MSSDVHLIYRKSGASFCTMWLCPKARAVLARLKTWAASVSYVRGLVNALYFGAHDCLLARLEVS